jgi:uncharacterized protein YggU (UPF0235/DUF167 family)
MAGRKPQKRVKKAEKEKEPQVLGEVEVSESEKSQEELEEDEHEVELVVSVSPTDGKAEVKTVKTVKVVSGINVIEVPVAGKTVAEIREALAQPLSISPEAEAVVDGKKVDEDDEKDVTIEEGQQLEFVKSAGVKG